MLWVASTAAAVPVPEDLLAEAATDEVRDSRTEDGSGYEVLSKLAQGVFPRIACPHFVKPDGLDELAHFNAQFLLAPKRPYLTSRPGRCPPCPLDRPSTELHSALI